MDWTPRRSYGLVLLMLLPFAHSWTTTNVVGGVVGSTGDKAAVVADVVNNAARARSVNEVSPYIDLVLCPIREQPWSCARQQSGRILDLWDSELYWQWQKLKVEADRQLNATIEKRGYSTSEILTKEKPSTILKKIEVGTDYMKRYLGEAMDGFLGREYDYVKTTAKQNFISNAVADEEEDAGGDDDDENEDEDNITDDESNDNDNNNQIDNDNDEETDTETETTNEDDEDYTDRDETSSEQTDAHAPNQVSHDAIAPLIGTATDDDASADNHDTSTAIEFIEIDDDANIPTSQLKKPGGGGNKKKRKNKKKKNPQTILVVQPAELEFQGHGHGGGGHSGGHHDGAVQWVPISQSKPAKKQKRKKKIKHQHVVVQEDSSDHYGLLEELANAVDVVDLDEGHKRKHKRRPHKYGRSVGVMRGKKKKRKAIAKLALIGTFLKAKIELLLKILGAHLQIKFLAIALIGLLINIARFWIDVKRGTPPQKVVYVEHAHHQHHYDDHADEWSGGESGGNWKRSLRTEPTVYDAAEDSYSRVTKNIDPQYMAYHGQRQ